jgi:hypothetical protein
MKSTKRAKLTFGATPFDSWNSDSTLSHFVKFAFDMELRMFGFDAFQLDCHFFARRDVCAEINVAKRARSYFPAQSISVSYTQLHGFQ